MRYFISFIALLLWLHTPLFAGNPNAAYYCSDTDKLIWFIHASDTHIGTSGSTDSTNLQWLVSQAKNVINPSFIVVSGDLTDSTNGNIFGYPNGPIRRNGTSTRAFSAITAWTPAFTSTSLETTTHTTTSLSAIIWQILCKEGQRVRTQASWTRTGTWGKYHFLGVNTADNTGSPFSLTWPYGDNAGLDSNELSFISSELATHSDATLTMAFGHHPLAPTGNSSDTYLFYGKDNFVSLMDNHGASLYGYGHTHASSKQFFTQNMTDGVLYFNVSALGKDSPNQYTVGAIDCNGISSVTQIVSTWPVVLITAPMDRRLGGVVNPYAYTVPKAASNPIRALVFDPATVTQVQFRVNGGVWQPMAVVSGNLRLWQGVWDASALSEGEYTLDVQAITGSGTRTDTVTTYVKSQLLYADFGTLGLWKHDGTSWSKLAPENPENIAVSGYNLYADLGTYGIWKHDGTSWSFLAPENPEADSASGSNLYADLGTYGIWKHDGTAWSFLAPENPEQIVASGSTLYADLGAYGIWKHDGTAWSFLAPENPENLVASGSTLYADLGAYGIWKHDGTAWSFLAPENPENLVASGSTLYADFGAYGIWKHDGTAWSFLAPENPENLVASGSTLYADLGALRYLETRRYSMVQACSGEPREL